MSSHSSRSAYFVCREGVLKDPDLSSPEVPTNGGPESAHPRPSTEPRFKFGRMFDVPRIKKDKQHNDAVVAELLQLADTINKTADNTAAGDSDIRAGYTYLGQFIAHEITFDKTEEPLEGENPGFRSPQIDLDSLYGRGPDAERRFYQDDARLKVGETFAGIEVRKTFYNDLPREGFGSKAIGNALIPDPRNDENLAVAQTHLAFIKFHNKVVDALHISGTPAEELFKTARKDVAQHFQYIILKDFLPKLLHKRGSECLNHPYELKVFKPDTEFGLCMPLEFSVAAFRFGHSMVRDKYEWNFIQNSGRGGAASINSLFLFTGFSGDLSGKPRLESDWIIDWRRFFDLTGVNFPDDKRLSNKARKIDASFSLRLQDIKGFPHVTKDAAHQSIVARNLLRGHACELPCGEDVAEMIGLEKEFRLTPAQIGIETPLLKGHTPLWYYILKEAEHNNGQLGPVASFIIAETLVGLIKNSPNSILDEKEKEWKPKYGRRFADGKFEMADLLAFAEVVDPIGDHMGPPLGPVF